MKFEYENRHHLNNGGKFLSLFQSVSIFTLTQYAFDSVLYSFWLSFSVNDKGHASLSHLIIKMAMEHMENFCIVNYELWIMEFEIE